MAHRHKAERTETRGYQGTAAGAHRTKTGEDRRAHGAVCHVDFCECGAKRETNTNGRFSERGEWQPPKRGPGRPSLTGEAEGTVQLTVRLTRDQAGRLDDLDEAHKLGGRAGAVRWAIDRA